MKFEQGEKIPEFKLKDHTGNEVSLSDFTGKNVLLSFHPLAWTSVCRKQMQSLEDNYADFTANNTVPLGLSIDPVPSKKAWAEKLEFENLKMLSDFWPHGEFAEKLGIFIEKSGTSGRVNILINDQGEILWSKEYELGELPDIEEVLEQVKDNS
ncbi:redoxin domain-containing protein [Halanaerobium salsuginis]|uniref:Peroxiredoxin n=1 Tax=Halanaerobium salsuginis TaxID=29563 RepID=A0A1I4H9A0_9FIRM|nr:redoxin domain-containing protein [Halanaerobium salsuginis]SFL38330.1 Peroxiredoxin [Halanaerobium salsuginis]